MTGVLICALLFALIGGISLNASKRLVAADAAAYQTLGFASVFVCIVLLGVAGLRYLHP